MIRKLPIIVLIVFSLFSRPAQAITLGDAALTVSVATVSGAILGTSTLPFYEESSKHTKNIFYGAAIGAVVGVFIAAYAGMKDGEEEEEVLLRRAPADARFAFNRQLLPEATSAVQKGASIAPMVWSPVASVKF